MYQQIEEFSLCKSWHYFLALLDMNATIFAACIAILMQDFFGIYDLVSTQSNEDMFPYVSNSEKWNVLILVFYTLIDLVNQHFGT